MRDRSVDFLRGLAMIIMAVDHVRHFLSSPFINPVDLNATYPSLFLTRWITHYCAPTFIFLAGLSVGLSMHKSSDRKASARFLVERGLLLVFLELTVIHWSWDFAFTGSQSEAGVIWAIGWSMIALSGLLFLPKAIVGVIGLLMVFGHNMFDGLNPELFGPFSNLWRIFHQIGFIQITPNYRFAVFYTLIPWIGVMALGYVSGELFQLPKVSRQKWFRQLGLGSVLLFLLLRASNFYGDAIPWTVQKDWLHTVLSFINCTKYPPSLLYLLMTLGPVLFLLGTLSIKDNFITSSVVTLGRVPMFFYLLHIPLIHGMSIGLAALKFGETGFLFSMNENFRTILPKGYGFSLFSIYGTWLLCILMLIVPCMWFDKIKSARKYTWLRYI